MRRVLVGLLPLVLAACAGGGPGSPAPAPAAEDALVVALDRGDGTEPERYTLSCADPAVGDLPDPAAACATLRGLTDPFAPPSGDVACTEIYGGPQTAQVTGRWAGADVDLALARTDGCQIAQWDRLGVLLPD